MRDYCHQHKALHVFWSFEDPLHTETWGMYYAEIGKPDYVFTHAHHSPSVYKRIGIPSSYLPFACNPKLHRALPAKAKYRSGIALVANYATTTLHSWRLKKSLNILLKPLLRHRMDIAIWGKGWRENKDQLPFHIPNHVLRGSLPYKAVPLVYASANIVLGVQNTPGILTRRTFECLATGGFLLTNHTPAVRRHFQPGKHLVTSRHPQETVKQIKHYLQQASKRKKIAKAEQHAVHRYHTYAERAQKMMEVLSPYLQAKKANRSVFVFPSRLKREIRPQLNLAILPRQRALSGQYIVAERPAAVNKNEDRRIYMWFDLKETENSLLPIVSAVLKLFLAMPSNNPHWPFILPILPLVSKLVPTKLDICCP